MNKSLTTLIAGCCVCGTLLIPQPCLATPPTAAGSEVLPELRDESKSAMTLEVGLRALQPQRVLAGTTPALASLDAYATDHDRELFEDDETDDAAEPNALTGLEIGGATMIGLGIGSLIWGSVELSRGVVVEDSGRERRERVNHRPAGNALIAVGAAAFVAGAVMLAVDWDRQPRQRKQGRGGAARFYPIFGTGGAGLGVSGTF